MKPTFVPFGLALVAVAVALHLPPAQDPIVHLDYGSFRGSVDRQLNISVFRRIPFAAPPTGQNRFGAPRPPLQVQDGIYDSDRSFPMCTHSGGGSEDCLYLGVYSRPWGNATAGRPVVVFFHGGGFIRGGGSFGSPPSGYPTLNVSAQNDFVLVYPNYRVNAFGFLPGRKVKESPNSALNPALLDQDAALRWVRWHISKFGGDPDNVAIWGQSAGGGAVIAQVLSTAKSRKLFNKAMISSPFWPKTYHYDSPEAEAIYDEMAVLAGCGGSKDSLQCLKEVDAQKIQVAAAKMSDERKYTTSSFMWAPVLDGTFLIEPLSVWSMKRRSAVPLVFGMYNSHEGENFVPPGLRGEASSAGFNSSSESFDGWIRGFLPGFDVALLQEVKDLYPARRTTEAFAYNSSYERAGVIYRDAVLTCPAFWIVQGAKSSWIGEYTIAPAKHASDTGYWNTVNALQTRDRNIYRGFAGALANFIQTGDPDGGSVTIPKLQDGRLWLVRENGFGTAETQLLQTRCSFWKRTGGLVPV